MDNQFLINLYFYKIPETPTMSRNFSPLQDELIEIKNIKDKDDVSEAIRLFDFRSKNIDSKNIVDGEEVNFSIRDSNKNTLWSGKGVVNGNQIDVLELKCDI